MSNRDERTSKKDLAYAAVVRQAKLDSRKASVDATKAQLEEARKVSGGGVDMPEGRKITAADLKIPSMADVVDVLRSNGKKPMSDVMPPINDELMPEDSYPPEVGKAIHEGVVRMLESFAGLIVGTAQTDIIDCDPEGPIVELMLTLQEEFNDLVGLVFQDYSGDGVVGVEVEGEVGEVGEIGEIGEEDGYGY